MAYFPHAFQKLMLATNATPFVDGTNPGGTSTTGSSTLTLAAGQIGVINAKTNKIADLATATATYANFPMFYLAQGSFHTKDILGSSLHGGYQETVKSKGINPKYISAFYYVAPKTPTQHILIVKPAQDCQAIACDTTYRLRVDVKGSPALRFLTHNLYQTVDAYTGCCNATDSNVDPMIVLLQWKERINESLILKDFIQAKVWNLAVSTTLNGAHVAATDLTVAAGTNIAAGQKVVLLTTVNGNPNNIFVGPTYTSGSTTVPLVDADGVTARITASTGVTVKFYTNVTTSFSSYIPEDPGTTGNTGAADTNDAFLELLGAYTDTNFTNCSFKPTDHYETQPVQIYASVVDDQNNPCGTTCFGSLNSTSFTLADMNTVFTNGTTGGIFETQTATQGSGFGETITRELILSNRYAQEPWSDSPRLREVLDDTTFPSVGGISRSSRYGAYYILHSVPRKSNPSGTLDSDQYLVKIVVNARSNAANNSFEAFMGALLTSAGSDVSLQVM